MHCIFMFSVIIKSQYKSDSLDNFYTPCVCEFQINIDQFMVKHFIKYSAIDKFQIL